LLSTKPASCVQACLADLQALLRGYQACRAQRQLEVVLWCSEALKLCAHVLAPSQQRFDVIDTFNLSDHVGLLSLLTHTARLLHRTPHARWTAQHHRTHHRTVGTCIHACCIRVPAAVPHCTAPLRPCRFAAMACAGNACLVF
jgi:hypothetical protein